MTEPTEASLLAVMTNIHASSLAPTHMVVSPYGSAVMRLLRRSWDERWDRRRRKRELRRADTSTYVKVR